MQKKLDLRSVNIHIFSEDALNWPPGHNPSIYINLWGSEFMTNITHVSPKEKWSHCTMQMQNSEQTIQLAHYKQHGKSNMSLKGKWESREYLIEVLGPLKNVQFLGHSRASISCIWQMVKAWTTHVAQNPCHVHINLQPLVLTGKQHQNGSNQCGTELSQHVLLTSLMQSSNQQAGFMAAASVDASYTPLCTKTCIEFSKKSLIVVKKSLH